MACSRTSVTPSPSLSNGRSSTCAYMSLLCSEMTGDRGAQHLTRELLFSHLQITECPPSLLTDKASSMGEFLKQDPVLSDPFHCPSRIRTFVRSHILDVDTLAPGLENPNPPASHFSWESEVLDSKEALRLPSQGRCPEGVQPVSVQLAGRRAWSGLTAAPPGGPGVLPRTGPLPLRVAAVGAGSEPRGLWAVRPRGQRHGQQRARADGPVGRRKR